MYIERAAQESATPPTEAQLRSIFTEEQIVEIANGVEGYGKSFSTVCETWLVDWIGDGDEYELMAILESFCADNGVDLVCHG